MSDHNFLTVRELGEYLRVSRTKAYQLISDGAVPAIKIGGQYRIPRVELDRQLAEQASTRRYKPVMADESSTNP